LISHSISPPALPRCTSKMRRLSSSDFQFDGSGGRSRSFVRGVGITPSSRGMSSPSMTILRRGCGGNRARPGLPDAEQVPAAERMAVERDAVPADDVPAAREAGCERGRDPRPAGVEADRPAAPAAAVDAPDLDRGAAGSTAPRG
jgi:hypothetical protein